MRAMTMAPSPRSPCTSLLLQSLLLFLLLSLSHSARVTAAVRNLPAEVGAGDEEAASFSTAAAEDERCGGSAGEGEGDEECLMRRTLVAHTDYIYTQGGKHN
ncbi:phytosulfokines 4 [Lolium perenne]|uniref:phytosulfokines 4 n=1 Tax=Lolium perenne TaxID=4522 RepID=UPI0021F6357F|nr:phytosulfokines 4-like [Lolium perenne]